MALSAAAKMKAYRERRYAEIALLPKIPCACGCGRMIAPIGRLLRPVRFVRGHNPQTIRFQNGHATWNKGRPHPAGRLARLGEKLPPEELLRRTATRRARYGGLYCRPTARGWKASEITRQRISEANRRRDVSGARNPAWEGGKSFQPYSADFTKRLKTGVLREQQHQCADCGALIGRRKGARRANVHHLDRDKANCSRENLVALCVPCHMRRHGDMRRKKRQEAA